LFSNDSDGNFDVDGEFQIANIERHSAEEEFSEQKSRWAHFKGLSTRTKEETPTKLADFVNVKDFVPATATSPTTKAIPSLKVTPPLPLFTPQTEQPKPQTQTQQKSNFFRNVQKPAAKSNPPFIPFQGSQPNHNFQFPQQSQSQSQSPFGFVNLNTQNPPSNIFFASLPHSNYHPVLVNSQMSSTKQKPFEVKQWC